MRISDCSSDVCSSGLGVDWKDFLEDVRLGADRNAIPIQYLPITASWRGDWSGDKQTSNITVSGIFGTRGIGTGGGFSFDGCVKDVDHFDCKRYKAKPNRSEEHTSELQSLMRTSYS